MLRPSFVLSRPSAGACERFYWPAALAIGVIATSLTYFYPTLVRRG